MPEKKSKDKEPTKKKDKEPTEKKENETSLEKSLQSSKAMGNELQNLIGALSQGKGAYRRKKKEEPIKKKVEKKEEQLPSKAGESTQKPPEPEIPEPKAPQLSPDSVQSKKIAEDYVKESTLKSVKEKPSFMDKEEAKEGIEEKTIYKKLEEFIIEFFEGNKRKYNEWESSVNSFVSVLRKMRKITKNNTKQLLDSIGKIETEYNARLKQFKLKRNEIEELAEVEMDQMAKLFNKVMGLMSIQLKDYELKRLTEDIYF
ncbi:MAG: hypothetical protein EU547_02095 [Promethearchaeota archaeon]|nr:MAG: hypothetical protein EU547_02095 [Candidatus Lokiarchaeota archaeon]